MAANKIQYREMMSLYTKWRRMRLTACMKMQINGDGIEYVELSIPLRHSTMPTTQNSELPRPSNAKSRRRKSRLEAFKKSKGEKQKGTPFSDTAEKMADSNAPHSFVQTARSSVQYVSSHVPIANSQSDNPPSPSPPLPPLGAGVARGSSVEQVVARSEILSPADTESETRAVDCRDLSSRIMQAITDSLSVSATAQTTLWTGQELAAPAPSAHRSDQEKADGYTSPPSVQPAMCSSGIDSKNRSQTPTMLDSNTIQHSPTLNINRSQKIISIPKSDNQSIQTNELELAQTHRVESVRRNLCDAFSSPDDTPAECYDAPDDLLSEYERNQYINTLEGKWKRERIHRYQNLKNYVVMEMLHDKLHLSPTKQHDPRSREWAATHYDKWLKWKN